MEKFAFNMGTFIAISEEQDIDLSPLTRHEVRALFPLYPELAHWSHFAFFMVWGAYSQDIYAISWVDWMTGYRDDGFLAYCYVCQRWPAFEFGGTGLYDEDIQQLAAQRPWSQSPLPPAPEWLPLHCRSEYPGTLQ